MSNKKLILEAFQIMQATANLDPKSQHAIDVIVIECLIRDVEDTELLTKFKDWLINTSAHTKEELLKVLNEPN